MNRQPRVPARYHLLTLLLAYLLLPLMLAAPLVALVPGLGLGGGYFEMLSCLTTTGATLFDRPQLLAEPLHLWRALVGWMGGLMVLVTAFAILAPLNLGGFEIGPAGRAGARRAAAARIEEASRAHPALAAADRADLCRADRRPGAGRSSSPATGRSSRSATRWRRSRPAASRRSAASRARSPGGSARSPSRSSCCRRSRTAASASSSRRPRGPRLSDPQIQLMLISVLGVTVRALPAQLRRRRRDRPAGQPRRGAAGDLGQRLHRAVLPDHHRLREPRTGGRCSSGRTCRSPGIILLGVAVMGGGIATTAGGVKLLRLYALYRHGLREMDRLIHPSERRPAGAGGRADLPRAARASPSSS